MSRTKEEISKGLIFGNWKIINEVESRNKQRYFKCVCLKCNKEKIAALRHIKYGNSTQCGSCANTEKNKIHGESKTRLYNKWNNMKRRCRVVPNYISMNINVCKEWFDYLTFKQWALSNGYNNLLTLDRIDNNKGYTPDNCRWVTQQVQAENQRHLKSSNTSGYKGVSFNKNRNKFVAQISVNNKHINLGSAFITAKEAAIAYDTFVINNKLINRTLNILQRI